MNLCSLFHFVIQYKEAGNLSTHLSLNLLVILSPYQLTYFSNYQSPYQQPIYAAMYLTDPPAKLSPSLQ